MLSCGTSWCKTWKQSENAHRSTFSPWSRKPDAAFTWAAEGLSDGHLLLFKMSRKRLCCGGNCSFHVLSAMSCNVFAAVVLVMSSPICLRSSSDASVSRRMYRSLSRLFDSLDADLFLSIQSQQESAFRAAQQSWTFGFSERSCPFSPSSSDTQNANVFEPLTLEGLNHREHVGRIGNQSTVDHNRGADRVFGKVRRGGRCGQTNVDQTCIATQVCRPEEPS